MLRRRRGLYYGWVVLAAISGVNLANAVTSIGVLTVFFIPMSDDFGWTRTQVSGATSLGAVLGAVTAPFIGRLSDRLGARVILVAGGVLIVFAMLYLSMMQSLLAFYVAFGLARLADQGFIQNVSPPAVAKWFLRYRGKALAALFFTTSAGGVVLPLMAQLMIGRWDWRAAWVVLGGVMLFWGVVPCAALVRRQPEDLGLRPDGRDPSLADADASPGGTSAEGPRAGDDGPAWRLGAALRTSTLWLLLGSVFMVGIGSTGIALHVVPYLVEQGIDPTAAAGAVSVSFLAAGMGNLVWGSLADRFSARYMLPFVFLTRAVSVSVLLMTSSPAEAYLFAVLRGFSEGGIAIVTTILLADYFGRRHLGATYGLTRAIQVLGYAIGPLASGVVYDVSRSYDGAFAAFLVITILASLLAATARRPAKTAAVM